MKLLATVIACEGCGGWARGQVRLNLPRSKLPAPGYLTICYMLMHSSESMFPYSKSTKGGFKFKAGDSKTNPSVK